MLFRRLLIAALIVIAGIAAYFAWMTYRIPKVDYITLQLSEAVETLLVSGRVTGEGAVPLSFKRPGQLVEITVQEGDEVFRGEILARLDDRQAKNLVQQNETNLSSAETLLTRIQKRDLPQAREALSQAESRVEIADNVYQSARIELLEPASERLKEAEEDERKASQSYSEQEILYRDGELTRDELDLAREEWDIAIKAIDLAREEEEKIKREIENLAREKEIALSQQRSAATALQSLENEEIKQARLSVTQARTQLEQSRLELEQTELEAPFNGVITMLSANIGQYVNVGQQVFMIIPSANQTFIEAQVDEEFAGKVITGQEVLVRSSAFSDQNFTGRVDRVSPTVDPSRGTFLVRLKLDQFEVEMLPDLAVNAEIITSRQEGSLVLEQGYTLRDNDQVYVFVEDSGRVKRQLIEVEELGRGLYLVTSGLSPGDRVLKDVSLQENQRIRLGEAGSSS